MLLLVSTSDVLRVVTSSASAIDVHASYVDRNTSTSANVVGSQNTAIASATTTTVVSAPASGKARNVRFLSIRNKGGDSCTVTVQLYNGTTAFELHALTMAAGKTLIFDDVMGWRYLT